MSGVRLLVGTRKGAFVLTSDGTRDDWNVEGPLFTGWEMYHLNASPVDPGPAVRVAVHRLARPGHPALGRRREDVGDGRQRVRVRRRPRHAPVVRRHAAPVGVRARLAPRAVADGRGHGVRRRRGRGALPFDRRGPDVAGAVGAARSRDGRAVAARRRRALPAHDHHPPRRPAADVRRDLGGGRVPHGRRRRDVAADQPRAALARAAGRGPRGRPLRPPDRHEPVAARHAVHAEALARDAQRRRRRLVAEGEREPAVRLRLPDRRPPARAGDGLRRADQERLRARSARRQAPRLPQPDRRERVGGAHERPAAGALLRERAPRRDGGGQRSIPAASTSGRRGGQVYASPDGGDSWTAIVHDLPAVLSVEAQTLS